MTLGEFIYKKRLLSKYTVREFAKLMQIEPNTVYLIENNFLLPKQVQINVMEDIFSLTQKEIEFLNSSKAIDSTFPKSIVENLPENKNPISAIRVPIGLNLTKKQWMQVTEFFNASVK